MNAGIKVYYTYAGWCAEGPNGETYGPFTTRAEARSVRRAAVFNAANPNVRTIDITMREVPQARQSFWSRVTRVFR